RHFANQSARSPRRGARPRLQLPPGEPAVTVAGAAGIAPEIVREYPTLNDAQRTVVAHMDGPLLVIAGPGSGKTFSLVLRALNLLLLDKAAPAELVICTFTEKAAFGLRDRVSAAARKLGYTRDLSDLSVSTLYGCFNHLLTT